MVAEQIRQRVETPRLALVACTVALAEAAHEGHSVLGDRLSAHVPPAWPPPLLPEAKPWMDAQLAQDPALSGWLLWYVLLTDEQDPPLLVGVCGFKGRPDRTGRVELGYSLLPAYQGHGYATEAVGAMVGWAFEQKGVRTIIADTLPHLQASIRVLAKNGFHHVGQGAQRGAIRFERGPASDG